MSGLCDTPMQWVAFLVQQVIFVRKLIVWVGMLGLFKSNCGVWSMFGVMKVYCKSFSSICSVLQLRR